MIEQIAAGNAGWRFQFRFAVHAGWSRVPELWTKPHIKQNTHYEKTHRTRISSQHFVSGWLLHDTSHHKVGIQGGSWFDEGERTLQGRLDSCQCESPRKHRGLIPYEARGAVSITMFRPN